MTATAAAATAAAAASAAASAPAAAASGPPRIIAVASGKGGVGKTWLSITLAHALARLGERVLLFDGDLGLANVDIQLGLLPRHDLGSVVAGRVGLADATFRHAEGGFDILTGRSGCGSLATLDPERLGLILASLRGVAARYDHVLLDLGAGLDRATRRMAAFADRLLVLVTDEPTSLTDAYAVLKLHASDEAVGEAAIVVNQAASPAAGERTAETLRRACTAFLGRTPGLAGIIRRDDRVRDAIRRQSLLLTRHPNAVAAADVLALARRCHAPRAARPPALPAPATLAAAGAIGRVPAA